MCQKEKVSGTRFGSSAAARSRGVLEVIYAVSAQFAGFD